MWLKSLTTENNDIYDIIAKTCIYTLKIMKILFKFLKDIANKVQSQKILIVIF